MDLREDIAQCMDEKLELLQRIAEQKQQLAEAQAEVEQLKQQRKAEGTERDWAAYERHWINRGMERAAEILEEHGNVSGVYARLIRAEIKDKNQKG